MGLVRWNLTSTNSSVTFMSTTLAAVASSTLSVVSSRTEVNTSGVRMYSDWELNVGTTVGAFGTGAAASLYLAPAIDGSTFVEGDRTQLQPLAIFPLTTSTANAQHRVSRTFVTLPPQDFGVYLYNGTTQAFSTGSGANTLTAILYDVQTSA